MMVSGLEDSETEKVYSNGQMALGMKASGKTTEPTVKENSLILMETSMMETGSMIKLMAMESIIISMELCMRDTGEMTFSTVRVRRVGPMDPFTKDSTWPERNMGLAFTAGTMALSIKVNGTRTKLKALVLTVG